jgi:hypothetical protein
MLNIPYNYDVRHIMRNKSDFFSHIIHTGGKIFGDRAFTSLFWWPSSSPMDEVSKILTPKKKDQSADTKPPSEIWKFSPWSILSKFQVSVLPIVHTSEWRLCISWTRRLICIVLWRNCLASRHVQQTWRTEQNRWLPIILIG